MVRLQQLFQLPEKHHLAAPLPRSGTHVQYQVSRADDLGIVFYNDQGVSRIPQAMQDTDQSSDIPRMQADTRLVQNKKSVYQRGTQCGCEVDPLHLAPAQSPRLPVQRKVAEAHVNQVSQTSADLTQKHLCRLIQGMGKHEGVEEFITAVDGQQHHLVHRKPTSFPERLAVPSEAPQEGFGFESCAPAVGTGTVGPVFGEKHPDMHLVALRLEPFEELPDPVPLAVFPLPLTFQYPSSVLLSKTLPWHVQRYAPSSSKGLQIPLALPVAFRLPGLHHSLFQGLGIIGYHEIVVDIDDASESPTGLACPQGRIEGEEIGNGIPVMYVAVGAVKVCGESEGGQRICPLVKRIDHHVAPAEFYSRLDILHDPGPILL